MLKSKILFFHCSNQIYKYKLGINFSKRKPVFYLQQKSLDFLNEDGLSLLDFYELTIKSIKSDYENIIRHKCILPLIVDRTFYDFKIYYILHSRSNNDDFFLAEGFLLQIEQEIVYYMNKLKKEFNYIDIYHLKNYEIIINYPNFNALELETLFAADSEIRGFKSLCKRSLNENLEDLISQFSNNNS